MAALRDGHQPRSPAARPAERLRGCIERQGPARQRHLRPGQQLAQGVAHRQRQVHLVVDYQHFAVGFRAQLVHQARALGVGLEVVAQRQGAGPGLGGGKGIDQLREEFGPRRLQAVFVKVARLVLGQPEYFGEVALLPGLGHVLLGAHRLMQQKQEYEEQ